MTLWEYAACVAGWERSQSGGHSVENAPMSDEEYDALCEIMDNLG